MRLLVLLFILTGCASLPDYYTQRVSKFDSISHGDSIFHVVEVLGKGKEYSATRNGRAMKALYYVESGIPTRVYYFDRKTMEVADIVVKYDEALMIEAAKYSFDEGEE